MEATLEAEESKVTRAQLELTQYKQEAEKRIADKDEELENLRKNHARQLESLQASLETEMKAKSDLVIMFTPLISFATSWTLTSNFFAVKKMKERRKV